MKSRKIILFIISLIAIFILQFLGKDSSYVVALYGVYCAGNVGSKFSHKEVVTSIEQEK